MVSPTGLKPAVEVKHHDEYHTKSLPEEEENGVNNISNDKTPSLSSSSVAIIRNKHNNSTILPFDEAIMNQFERCRTKNLLRTDPLVGVHKRVIPGSLNLITTFDEDHFSKKRCTVLPKNVSMDQAFDANTFNFNKTSQSETLVRVDLCGSVHSILVNVSPLMYGHGLLIPWSERGYAQRLTANAVDVAIDLLRMEQQQRDDDDDDDDDYDDGTTNKSFRIGFNSLGAFSSVNHLHLHILYPGELHRIEAEAQPEVSRAGFPIEHASSARRFTTGECTVDILDWMVPCFSFHAAATTTNRTSVDMERVDRIVSAKVSNLVTILQDRSIPHNVLFLKGPRVIVIPRQPQHHFDSNEAGFNAALGEISGLIVSKSLDDYRGFEEERVKEVMRDSVACDDALMDDLLSNLMDS